MNSAPGHRRAAVAVPAVILAVPLLTALLGSLVSPWSATAPTGPALAGPDRRHLLGTDLLGRDVLSRLLEGGRTLVVVALAAVLIAETLAVGIGLLAARRPRTGARVVLRALDTVLALPPVLVLAVAVTGLGGSTGVTLLAVTVVLVPGSARVVHSAARQLVGEPYVEAAMLRGESGAAIVRRELLPNLWTVITADAGLRTVEALLVVTAAGFLGFGVRAPAPHWGQMISENSAALVRQPWAVAAPALALTLLATGVNLVGDHFTGPRLPPRRKGSR